MVCRDGRTRRQAVLSGGPDVRAVLRAVKSSRRAEPDLDPAGVLALDEANRGVPARLIDVAVRYWSSRLDEIDVWIADGDALEAEALAAWERHGHLLAR